MSLKPSRSWDVQRNLKTYHIFFLLEILFVFEIITKAFPLSIFSLPFTPLFTPYNHTSAYGSFHIQSTGWKDYFSPGILPWHSIFKLAWGEQFLLPDTSTMYYHAHHRHRYNGTKWPQLKFVKLWATTTTAYTI